MAPLQRLYLCPLVCQPQESPHQAPRTDECAAEYKRDPVKDQDRCTQALPAPPTHSASAWNSGAVDLSGRSRHWVHVQTRRQASEWRWTASREDNQGGGQGGSRPRLQRSAAGSSAVQGAHGTRPRAPLQLIPTPLHSGASSRSLLSNFNSVSVFFNFAF